MKKRIFSIVLLIISLFLLSGCEDKKEEKQENISGSLEEIMSKVYEGISEEEMPMFVENQELNEENIEHFIGTSDIKWKEALASEAMITSSAHSVVLVRLKDDATQSDIEDAKEKIKANANPRKWVCVEAEHVYVENKGNLIILIMTNELADTLKANFEGLK